MPTHTLASLKDMTPGDFGEEHRQMLDGVGRHMPAEAEALLDAVGKLEIDALVDRFNGAYRVINQLNAAQGVTPKDLRSHFSALQKIYGSLKAAVRRKLTIHKEDPRYATTRNIADSCATLHARILAALEKGFDTKPKASDTADDLGFDFGNGVKFEDDDATATPPKEPTA